MSEIRTKLIGSNFDTLKEGRKYFHFAVVTGANVITELNEYITRKLPKYFKTFEYYDANVEINGYSNEGFGVSIIWEIMDAPLNGRFTDKDASSSSTFKALIHDIKELGGESTNYFLFNCDYTMDKDFVIKTLESIRRDIVFKSDLYAGKLLGEAIYDIGLLFDYNNTLSPNEGRVDIDKLTEDADKPMASVIKERDALIEQINSMDKAIKAANEKLSELNNIISQEETKNNPIPKPTVPTKENPEQDEAPNIREIIEAAQKSKVKENTDTMKRTEEVIRTESEVKDKDTEIARINSVLDGINVNIETTDTNEVKEKIEEVTADIKNITEKVTIKDNTVTTDEVKEVVNKDVTTATLNTTSTTPDTVLPEEKTIYDGMNQKRDIKSYIENMISNDSEFSGDWEDELELYQIVLSNDNKAREELSKEEYKEYVDFILSNTLNKEHEPNSTGVYNLRTAKYSSIGTFDFIANGNN